MVVLVCLILLYFHAPALNVMSSGDDEVAKSLGIRVEAVRVQVGILSVLMTAAVISFTGVIGFVGLAGPHIARMIIGNGSRYLLPFSAVTGAILMLVADTIGRLILAPVTIPVGIIIFIFGRPDLYQFDFYQNERGISNESESGEYFVSLRKAADPR